MKKIKLFCFPYAGGSSAVYIRWKAYLDKRVDLIPVEFAGRGKSINRPFYKSVSEAVQDIYGEIGEQVSNAQFAFFGHSMGSVFVYELCRKIKEEKGIEPMHIFVSGRYPPHITKGGKLLHNLSDDEFIDEIVSIGGTSKAVFENKEFAKLFIPILRSDYKLIEQYKFCKSNFIFNCGITVFSGKFDKIARKDEMAEWQKYTMDKCNFYEFEGNHFFIHDNAKDIVSIINKTICSCG